MPIELNAYRTLMPLHYIFSSYISTNPEYNNAVIKTIKLCDTYTSETDNY